MFNFIFLVVVGLASAYISKSNSTPVFVKLGPYTVSNIPLFYVIIGSLLLGIALSFVINFIRSIFTTIALKGKDHQIKKHKEEILELTKQVHQLEIENNKLSHDSPKGDKDQNAL